MQVTSTEPITPLIARNAGHSAAVYRQATPFPNARTAFKAFMQSVELTRRDEVLLPAYVGWSSKEGSGVFDPVQELGLRYSFYRLSNRLEIDVEDLKRRLTDRPPRLLVLIHYFGYPDSNIAEIIDYARRRGVLVLEDEAHAMYSDLIGGICGRGGDAAIISLHKMLPVRSGGLLIRNRWRGRPMPPRITRPPHDDTPHIDLCHYDLHAISDRRRNALCELTTLLHPLRFNIEPLYPELRSGVVPHSCPVLVRGNYRNELYFAMNAAGYGVVSLYHTLIRQIDANDFPETHWLSQHILNLPVHQDVDPSTLRPMIGTLTTLVTKYDNRAVPEH